MTSWATRTLFLTAGLAQQPRTAITFSPPPGGEGVGEGGSRSLAALNNGHCVKVSAAARSSRNEIGRAIHECAARDGTKNPNRFYTGMRHRFYCGNGYRVTYSVESKGRSEIKTKPVLIAAVIAYGNFSPPRDVSRERDMHTENRPNYY